MGMVGGAGVGAGAGFGAGQMMGGGQAPPPTPGPTQKESNDRWGDRLKKLMERRDPDGISTTPFDVAYREEQAKEAAVRQDWSTDLEQIRANTAQIKAAMGMMSMGKPKITGPGSFNGSPAQGAQFMKGAEATATAEVPA